MEIEIFPHEICSAKQRKINNFQMGYLSICNALSQLHIIRKALQHHSYIRLSCVHITQSFGKEKSHRFRNSVEASQQLSFHNQF